MSVRLWWLMVLLSSSMTLLILCLIDLSIIKGNVLKCSTIIVDVSISSFSSISFGFTYFAALLFGEYTFKIAMSSCWSISFLSHNFFFLWSLLYLLLCPSAFFWLMFAKYNLFHPFNGYKGYSLYGYILSEFLIERI